MKTTGLHPLRLACRPYIQAYVSLNVGSVKDGSVMTAVCHVHAPIVYISLVAKTYGDNEWPNSTNSFRYS